MECISCGYPLAGPHYACGYCELKSKLAIAEARATPKPAAEVVEALEKARDIIELNVLFSEWFNDSTLLCDDNPTFCKLRRIATKLGWANTPLKDFVDSVNKAALAAQSGRDQS